MRNTYSKLILILGLAATNYSNAGELFPFDPPTSSCEQSNTESPALTHEDRQRISNHVAQIKNLSSEQKHVLNATIYNNIDTAIKNGKLSQVLFYNQLLRETN
ncbi:MAG: hypothetical protein SGJ18_12745 [Pseudomonadota bacterium]|nr:hypothetical protein [Pseudomonadota bacterium]